MTDVRTTVVQPAHDTVRSRRDIRGMVRRFVLRDGLALLVFGLVTILMLLPVLPKMRTAALGGPGDIIVYIYTIGWMAQGLALGDSPLVDPRTNFPDGLAVTSTDEPYLWILLFSPLTLALGPTFTYNLMMLLGTFLTGYVTFLWIRRMSGSWAGAIIAGLAFMLAPARVSHSFGQIALLCTFVVPLFFWKLDSVLVQPRPRVRDLVALAVATFVLGSTSQYMLTLCLLAGVFYTLFMVLPKLRYLLVHGWGIALSVLSGAALSLVPDLLNAGKNLYREYLVSDIRIWAADPLNFVLPSRLHPLWGEAIEHLRSEPYWGEKTLYLGLVAVVLAVLAFRNQNVTRRRLWTWLGAATIAAIFALGRDLHINNQPLQPDNPVLLPAAYLAEVPFMNVIRVWPRLGIITSFFVACLAGVGAAWLVQRFPRRPVLALVGLLLLIDFMPPILATFRVEPRPVERWLAQQPGDFAVAFLPPFGPGEDTSDYEALYGSLFHAKHLPAFHHPFHRPQAYEEFVAIAKDFPAQVSVERLRARGYRYLLLERSRFNGQSAPAWATIETQLAQHPELEIVTTEGDVVVVGFR